LKLTATEVADAQEDVVDAGILVVLDAGLVVVLEAEGEVELEPDLSSVSAFQQVRTDP
jgi:hypothetical protein